MKTLHRFLILLALIGTPLGWLVMAPRGSIQVERPEMTPPGELPPPPVSRIQVPIWVSMEDLRSLADRGIPSEMTGSGPIREGAFRGIGRYRVQRQGDVAVIARDGRLTLSVPARFQAQVTGSGEVLGISIPVSVSAQGSPVIGLSTRPRVDRDWRVAPDLKVWVQWREPPRAEILGVSMTFQGAADRFVEDTVRRRRGEMEAWIDRELGLKGLIEERWRELQEPVALSEDPPLWLMVSPLSIRVPPVEVTPRGVLLDVTIGARVGITTDLPASRDLIPLPSPEEVVSDGGGFRIQAAATLGYQAMNRILNRELAGRSIPLGGRGSVKISGVEVRPNGEALTLAVQLEASEGPWFLPRRIQGTGYVTGVPRWDRESRTIRIEEVDFDPGTIRGLARAASWVIRPELLKALEASAVFPMGERLEELERSLDAMLRDRSIGGEVRIDGSVRRVTLDSVSVTRDGLVLLLMLEGDATLRWVPR